MPLRVLAERLPFRCLLNVAHLHAIVVPQTVRILPALTTIVQEHSCVVACQPFVNAAARSNTMAGRAIMTFSSSYQFDDEAVEDDHMPDLQLLRGP